MDDIQAIHNAFSEQNTGLENFFKQNKTNLTNASNSVKTLQDDLLTFKNDMDNTLKQIEMDIEQNRSMLAKWVDGSNSKLRHEQISQKRMALMEGIKKINDDLSRFSQELSKQMDDFNTASQQFTLNYKNLENQLKSSVNNLTNVQNNMAASAGSPVQNLQDALQQAINALSAAQHSVMQRKFLSELNSSIENIVH